MKMGTNDHIYLKNINLIMNKFVNKIEYIYNVFYYIYFWKSPLIIFMENECVCWHSYQVKS